MEGELVQAYKEGWELLKDATMAVTHLSEEKFSGHEGFEATRKLWEQVRARLDEKMPEHRMLDVMGSLLQAELRINQKNCTLSNWSNQMLIERLDERLLRELVEEATSGWRLAGEGPSARIMTNELADIYDEACRLKRERGVDDPEYQAKGVEVQAFVSTFALSRSFMQIFRLTEVLENRSRHLFMRDNRVEFKLPPDEIGLLIDEPISLSEMLRRASAFSCPDGGRCQERVVPDSLKAPSGGKDVYCQEKDGNLGNVDVDGSGIDFG